MGRSLHDTAAWSPRHVNLPSNARPVEGAPKEREVPIWEADPANRECVQAPGYVRQTGALPAPAARGSEGRRFMQSDSHACETRKAHLSAAPGAAADPATQTAALRVSTTTSFRVSRFRACETSAIRVPSTSFCQNGQSRGRRFRALGCRVLGADCTAICSGWPMRNRCGTLSTNVFSTE